MNQKKPRVRNFSARNFGAKNGTNFMGAWIFWFYLLENPMPIKFLLFLGGGSCFFLEGVGSADFIFMGVGIFLIERLDLNLVPKFVCPIFLVSAQRTQPY